MATAKPYHQTIIEAFKNFPKIIELHSFIQTQRGMDCARNHHQHYRF